MSSYTNIKIIHLTEPGQVELAYTVRHDVYVREQSYDLNTVTDELSTKNDNIIERALAYCMTSINRDDQISQHWAAVADKVNEDGTIIEESVPIGTIRLCPKPNNVARLGRVAVISSARGLKCGPLLIDTFENYCVEHKFHTIYLHAVSEKIGFYEKLGYVVEKDDDEEFTEDGTPHIRLWKRNLLERKD